MMKKILFALVCTLLAFSFPVAAFAEGEATPSLSAASQQTPMADAQQAAMTDAAPAVTSELSIDTENIYEGMDKPYKDGYMPGVSGDKATIILPLLPVGSIKGNSLTASLELGDPSSAPFIFKSYEKQVKLSSQSINAGSGTIDAYYVSFELSLIDNRYMGTYPVNVAVKAASDAGDAIEQSFTLYIRIADGKDPNATPPPEPVEKPTTQPIVLVAQCRQSPSPVEAGQEVALDITLQNTHEKKYIQNMTVTLTCEGTGIELSEDSNTMYFKKLDKGDSLTLKVKYKTSLDTPAGEYTVNVSMTYDNSDATTLSSTGAVTFDVKQPCNVVLTMPQIAAEVNAGDTLPLSIQVMNLSRGPVYNVRCELAAPGLFPNGTGFIGNMEAGTAGTAEMNVFVGTMDMTEGYTGEKYGHTSGVLTLVFEDADGEEQRQEFELYTMINAPVIEASTEPEEEPQKQTQWWIAIVIGAVLIGGAAIWLAVRNKRRKHIDEDI